MPGSVQTAEARPNPNPTRLVALSEALAWRQHMLQSCCPRCHRGYLTACMRRK